MDRDINKKRLLKIPKFRHALKDTEPEFKIARAFIEVRLKKGYSKQLVTSRVENAKTSPSISFLKHLVAVLGTTLQVRFE